MQTPSSANMAATAAQSNTSSHATFPSHINIRVHGAQDPSVPLVEVLDQQDFEPFFGLGKCYDGDSAPGGTSPLDEYLNKRDKATLIIDLRNSPHATSVSSRFRIQVETKGANVPLRVHLWEHASHIKILSLFSISSKSHPDNKIVGHHTITYSKIRRTDFTDKFVWRLQDVEEVLKTSAVGHHLEHQRILLAYHRNHCHNAPVGILPTERLTVEALDYIQCHFLFFSTEHHLAGWTCLIAPFDEALKDYGMACAGVLPGSVVVKAEDDGKKEQLAPKCNGSYEAIVSQAVESPDSTPSTNEAVKIQKKSVTFLTKEEEVDTFCFEERSLQWE